MQDQLIQEALARVHQLPDLEKRELLSLLEERDTARVRKLAQNSFMEFTQAVWPTFISGSHHQIMAETFDRIASGQSKRVIINMAPRHTKSEFASFLLPAWFLGKFPDKKVIQTSNTADLAAGFGRRVRNLIADDPDYRKVFPGLELAKDSQAANHWHTNSKGEYFAIGVDGKVTGKGADLFIIDDPHSEQEAKQAERNPAIFDAVYDWYTSGPRQRLQPGGAIVIVMTRWGKRDLTGRVIEAMVTSGDEYAADDWEVIELPAILDEREDNERPIWPEFWSLKELQATRHALTVPQWQAQYQQKPTSEEGAIIKREWWKPWVRKDVPTCEFILQSWDTAFTAKERNDYSACTTWGVFRHEDDVTGRSVQNLILLDAERGRWEFPDLKPKVKELYNYWEPDMLLVEARGSGVSLIQELRAMNIPVWDATPSRGKRGQSNDKVARANAVADIFKSGYVWAPDRRFAEDVIEECASFPSGDHDDYVDTVTQALKKFREGGLVSTRNDDYDDEDDAPHHNRAAYY